jgi:hypothetical protein
MKIIRPFLARIIVFAARLATRYDPARLVSSTAPKSSSVIMSSNLSLVMPALATSTSTGPWAASASLNAASTAAGSVTSALTPSSPAGGSPVR